MLMKQVVHPLRNLLSKLRWQSREDPDRYVITYRHRGAANDVKEIQASTIQRLGKSYFTLHSEDGEEVTIPFHRILRISDKETNSVIWRSHRKTQSDSS